MANVCKNQLYFQTQSEANLKVLTDFFDSWSYDGKPNVEWIDGEAADVYFSSKWTFPLEEMEELYNNLPDKSDIYIRCLSSEFGCYYHALWVCNEDGWKGLLMEDKKQFVARGEQVVHPSHYQGIPGIECIDVVRHMNFNIGNVLKYCWRAGLKHEEGISDREKHLEDLNKALFYLNDEIKRLKNE